MRLWRDYRTLVLAVPAVLLLIIGTVTLLLHVHKAKKMKLYNYDELADWIKKERSVGREDSEIKSMLKGTTWGEGDIKEAFRMA